MKVVAAVPSANGCANGTQLPPCDLDAERAVLGSMLRDNSFIQTVAKLVSYDELYAHSHQIAFAAIVDLYVEQNRPVDSIVLFTELKRQRNTGDITKAYIAELWENAPASTQTALQHAKIVKDKAALRGFNRFGNELAEAASNGQSSADVVARFQGKFELIATLARHDDPAQTFTAADLARMELPDAKFSVEGIFPDGLSILASKPKLGKSWLLLAVTIAVALGGVALGKIPVQAGSVLYLALEDTRRRLQSRIKRLCADSPPPANLTLATSWPTAGRGGIDAIREWLKAHGDARLVGIDTYAKFRTPRARSTDKYAEDYSDVGAIKRLADEFGVSIVVVHHERKLISDDPLDAVSGTLGLSGAADAVQVLKKDRGQHDATLFVTGRDIEEQEMALQWDNQLCLWTLLGQAAEYRMTAERAEVLAVLRAAGQPLKPSEVRPLLKNKSADATRYLLSRMAKDGTLAVHDGRYSPTITHTPHGTHTPHSPYKVHSNGHVRGVAV